MARNSRLLCYKRKESKMEKREEVEGEMYAQMHSKEEDITGLLVDNLYAPPLISPSQGIIQTHTSPMPNNEWILHQRNPILRIKRKRK